MWIYFVWAYSLIAQILPYNPRFWYLEKNDLLDQNFDCIQVEAANWIFSDQVKKIAKTDDILNVFDLFDDLSSIWMEFENIVGRNKNSLQVLL